MRRQAFALPLLITAALVCGVVVLYGSLDSGGRNTWVCRNGQWIRRGVPTVPTPSISCQEVSEVFPSGIVDGPAR